MSRTSTPVPGASPSLRATSRNTASPPTGTVPSPTRVFSIPTSTVPGMNETRSSLLSKSGSKLKIPANGTVLLDSARLSTWVSGAVGRQRALDRDHAVLARTELGDVADDDREPRVGGAPMLSPVGS